MLNVRCAFCIQVIDHPLQPGQRFVERLLGFLVDPLGPLRLFSGKSPEQRVGGRDFAGRDVAQIGQDRFLAYLVASQIAA